MYHILFYYTSTKLAVIIFKNIHCSVTWINETQVQVWLKIWLFWGRDKLVDRQMNIKLDMCLWNKDAPGGNKVNTWQNLSPTFWTPPPKGHVMSGKCEQPLDEFAVQVSLLFDHPNFKHIAL